MPKPIFGSTKDYYVKPGTTTATKFGDKNRVYTTAKTVATAPTSNAGSRGGYTGGSSGRSSGGSSGGGSAAASYSAPAQRVTT